MKTKNIYDIDDIHDLSIHNWNHKKSSKKCGCFYCINIYDASALKKEEQPSKIEDTWFCKICWVDSLIFDSAYDFDEKLLRKMQEQRFSDDIKKEGFLTKIIDFITTWFWGVPRILVVRIYDYFKYPEIKDKWRTVHFSRLWLYSGWYPRDVFDYFTYEWYWQFSPKKQKQLRKGKVFSDEEFWLLKDIYDRMLVYWNNCENIDETKLDDKEAIKIKNLIIEFFNLPSMEKDFSIIKKWKYYDWFAG